MHNTDHTTRFDENNYLFNPNSKCGIYLIHGFSSTTYEVKNLAKTWQFPFISFRYFKYL